MIRGLPQGPSELQLGKTAGADTAQQACEPKPSLDIVRVLLNDFLKLLQRFPRVAGASEAFRLGPGPRSDRLLRSQRCHDDQGKNQHSP
jgi:hypothetical protein